MKTAVSVPDDVFRQAEGLAKRLKVSRSELYSRAVSEYVSRHSPDEVTDALNTVCAAVEGDAQPIYRVAARKVLKAAEW